MTAAHKLEMLMFCTKLSTQGQLRAPSRQAVPALLPSITSWESHISSPKSTRDHNTRTAHNKKVAQPAQRGPRVGHTGRKSLWPSAHAPAQGIHTHARATRAGSTVHTPLRHTALLDSTGSLHSLTSKLPLSTHSKTRKNCKILAQNAGWLGETGLWCKLPLEVSSPSHYSKTMLK